MKYSDIFLRNHDVDFFFVMNNKLIHIASAGDLIIDNLNNKIVNEDIAEAVADLEYRCEVDINEKYIKDNIIKGDEDSFSYYIYTFRKIAEKGIYTYDKTNIGENNHKYHLVAKPHNPIDIKDLKGMVKTIYSFDYEGDERYIDLKKVLNIKEVNIDTE